MKNIKDMIEYNDILKYLSFKMELVPRDWLAIGAAFAGGGKWDKSKLQPDCRKQRIKNSTADDACKQIHCLMLVYRFRKENWRSRFKIRTEHPGRI